MIKYTKLLLIFLFLPLVACAEKSAFEEDKHYTVITTERSAKPQVTEFFSYFCPHCAKFEGVAQRLDKELAPGVFVKNHVNFMRSSPTEAQSALSMGYIIAKQLGKGDIASNAIFSYIHNQRGHVATLKDVRSMFLVNDVMTGEEFDRLSTSVVVNGQQQYMVEQQDRFAKLGALNSVPTFIVNDIYKLDISSVSSYEELKALIDYLLEK